MFFKKSLIISIIALVVLSAAMPTLAQYGLEETAEAANISTEGGDLPTTVGSIISIGLGAIGIIFLVLLVYAGFLWMTAMGDPKKVSTAKDLIIAAVSGIIVIVLAYSITSFVLSSLSDVGGGAAESAEETD
jgi:uncharacterized BrkB/YihY/UPF0761 family membrane protein